MKNNDQLEIVQGDSIRNLFAAASEVIWIYKMLTVIRRYISGIYRQPHISVSH